jgi:citrate synthase
LGDPRAAALLEACPPPLVYAGLVDVARDLIGEPPNVDFALAALTDALDLPRNAPLTLFALARSVGWAAHALEQIVTGTLIRPRARYSGPRPG